MTNTSPINASTVEGEYSLKKDISPDLITFELGGKKSHFGIKDEKWQFWGDLEIDKSAELLFEVIKNHINTHASSLSDSTLREVMREVGEDIDISVHQFETDSSAIDYGKPDDLLDYGIDKGINQERRRTRALLAKRLEK